MQDNKRLLHDFPISAFKRILTIYVVSIAAGRTRRYRNDKYGSGWAKTRVAEGHLSDEDKMQRLAAVSSSEAVQCFSPFYGWSDWPLTLYARNTSDDVN
jgi:hypothetical protein